MVVIKERGGGNYYEDFFTNNLEFFADYLIEKIDRVEDEYFNEEDFNRINRRNKKAREIYDNILPGLDKLFDDYGIDLFEEEYEPYLVEFDLEYVMTNDRKIRGLNDELIPLELAGFNKIYEHRDTRNDRTPQIIFYAKVGDIVYLDDRLKEHIPKEISDNVLYLHNFDSLLCCHFEHATVTVQALNYFNFKDKVVLDVGCGDGALSILTKRKGAKKVYGLDVKKKMEKKYYKNIEINNLEKNDFLFINQDIRRIDAVNSIPIDEIDIAIANLGPHYDGADLGVAVFTANYLQNASVFVGGGYSTNYFSTIDTYNYQEIINILSKKGFKMQHKVIEEYSEIDYKRYKDFYEKQKRNAEKKNVSLLFNEEPNKCLAFIARRDL
jgi:SAM-dependent methyltransferase